MMIGWQQVVPPKQACRAKINKLSNIEVRSEVWIITQVILLGVLIFASFPESYAVTSSLKLLAYLFEILAVIIGVVAIYSLRKSLSVAPQPVEAGQLEVNGIYRYIRHPMYLSVFLISIGIAINSGSYYKFGVVILIIIFFRIKTEYEERLLVKKYSKYQEYMKKTGRYLPMFKQTDSGN